MLLVVALVWLFVNVVFAGTIYKDARRHGMNTWFYPLLALLFGILGILWYLLDRSPVNQQYRNFDSR